MKIILRIITVLLVASVVAGAFTLAVNSSTGTDSNGSEQLSAMSSDSQSSQPMTRPEGSDHESESIAGGLAGVFVTLGKLTGIAILVLLIQKVFNLLGHRKLIHSQR